MKLTLKTERLAELSTDDLNRVAGGAQPLTVKDHCVSLLPSDCGSWQACTTAMSCGCPPTWNCA